MAPSTNTPEAHPRAGGENDGAAAKPQDPTGSSPRGRGKLDASPTPVLNLGLIPARAGKTDTQAKAPSRSAAHPRAGGENAPLAPTPERRPGSSPRGRGKRTRPIRGIRLPGLIPARAGKTTQTQRSSRPGEAHPRAGGENGSRRARRSTFSGSSPRGRRKRPSPRRWDGTRRLIPARAGKTETA